jgi:hypothetical protein
MGYFICFFPLKSDLCRYFFQDVKKTDCGGKNDKWNNGGLKTFFTRCRCEYTVVLFPLMGDSVVLLVEFVLCFLYIFCIFYHETGF